MKQFVSILLILPVTLSVDLKSLHADKLASTQFNYLPDKAIHPLCELGCSCAIDGQPLAYLDCSRHDIKSLPTSVHLDSSVSKATFQNNGIRRLRMTTFSVADNIEEIDFSLNQLSVVENYAFASFKSLTSLRLSHNKLGELESEMLEGLNSLKILELGHNAIQKLSPLVFKGAPNLQELRLQYNPLFDLDEQTFYYLPKLERLDLEDTGLVVLPSDIFKPTPHLQWLSLSHNAFENVPEDALFRAAMLKSIDLSGNDFESLEPGDFGRLASVTTLYLNNLSKLTRIGKDALAGLSSLRVFSCSFNPNLAYIDEGAFGGDNSSVPGGKTWPHEQLYLSQNGLRTLKSPLNLDRWSALNFVDLADNPWICDCNLLWMRELKTETQMNIRCASPPYLKGRPMHTLQVSDLRCRDDKWSYTIFVLTIATMVAVGMVALAASAIVCSRSRVGLMVRARTQFAYAKVSKPPKAEVVDLEWDPSADVL